ncbi:hypothetical protein DB31_5989 [Hyalangium minutum]|uniref:Uncharacterized protein n=1 Tax=Hyalangium minutum TaxID=394096 RepID=A0A085VXF5_9BACT|nr:hypothetical protein DB31_5989 [Hyalangium minutum]
MVDLLRSATVLQALTLKQPWASAVAELGKDVENRGWEPPAHAVGKLLAIHAGQDYDTQGAYSIVDVLGLRVPGPRTCVKGAVVAVAVLARAVHNSPSRWAVPGQVHWVLEGTVRLARPVQSKGALGLWNLTPGRLEEVRRQVLEAEHLSAALREASPTEGPPTGHQRALAEAVAATRPSHRAWAKGSARGAGGAVSTGTVHVRRSEPQRFCEKCGLSRPGGSGPHAPRLMRDDIPGWPVCVHGRRYLADCQWQPAGPRECCAASAVNAPEVLP